MGDGTDLQSLMKQKATVISTNKELSQGSIRSTKEKELSRTTTEQKVNVTDKLRLEAVQSPERKVQGLAVANVTMNASDVSQRDTLQKASSPKALIQDTKSNQTTPQAKGRGRFARSASKFCQFATNRGKALAKFAERTANTVLDTIEKQFIVDSKHDKVSVSEAMSQSEPKYEIKRDPYHEAKLVYSGQNSQGTRSYHTERVNAPTVSNNVIHSVHGILTKVFKTHSITTDLIDSSYLYGAGIDLQWNTLWSYRSIHGQTTMAFLQDHYFSSHKDEYFQ